MIALPVYVVGAGLAGMATVGAVIGGVAGCAIVSTAVAIVALAIISAALIPAAPFLYCFERCSDKIDQFKKSHNISLNLYSRQQQQAIPHNTPAEKITETYQKQYINSTDKSEQAQINKDFQEKLFEYGFSEYIKYREGKERFYTVEDYTAACLKAIDNVNSKGILVSIEELLRDPVKWLAAK